MDSRLSDKDARRELDARRDADAPTAVDHMAHAEDVLSRLVREAARENAGRRPGPPDPERVASPGIAAEPHLAAPTIEVAPAPPEPDHLGVLMRPRRSAASRLVRLAGAVGLGVGATLAWQTYGDEARRMVAIQMPALGPALGLMPEATPPALAKPPVTVQANTAPATPAAPAPAATPDAVAALAQDVKAIARDMSAVRQSLNQVFAGQHEMARTIAALQAAEEESRARSAAMATPAAAPTAMAVPMPPPAPARKPAARPAQAAPQVVAPAPRPLSQSFTPSPGPPPQQPAPPRPPGAMP